MSVHLNSHVRVQGGAVTDVNEFVHHVAHRAHSVVTLTCGYIFHYADLVKTKDHLTCLVCLGATE